MNVNHILVPVVRPDTRLENADTNKAVLQAVNIAQTSNATLTFVAYDNPMPPAASYWSTIKEELVAYKRQFCEEALSRFVAYAAAKGVRANSHVVIGNPLQEILNTIETESIDLVIKEAPHVDFLGIHRLSGDDLSLLRMTRIPVWLIPEDTPMKDAHTVLLALDVQSADQSLNKTMLKNAYAIATQHNDGKLHIIHTWLSPFEGYAQNYFGRQLSPSDTPDDIEGTIIKEHEGYIDKLLMAADLKNNDAITVHTLNGSASAEITKMARSLPADLMIIGSHARKGINRFMNGNTAENIAAATQCP